MSTTTRPTPITQSDWPGTPRYRRIKGRYRADTPPKVGPRALDRLLRRTPRGTS